MPPERPTLVSATDAPSTMNDSEGTNLPTTETNEQSELNAADYTPPPSSKKPERSWRHVLNLCQTQYVMPSTMIALITLGILAALGHHLYYRSLHGQVVQDSQWPVRLGTAIAFFLKAVFISSIETAYRQHAWLMVKRRSYKISTLDALFSACFNPWVFTNFQFLSEAYLAAVIALSVWLLPLSAIASPSTLTVRNAALTTPGTCNNVSMLDFTRENGFGADSDDQERSGMSYWNEIRDDKLLVYDKPSGELARIFQLAFLSYTGPPKPSNPCLVVEECTLTIDIAAPAYSCQPREEFGGNNPLGSSKSQLSATDLLYTAYSSIEENELGWPAIWDSLPGSSPGGTKGPWDSDYQQFSGYHAASFLFRTFMFGNLTYDSKYGFIDGTDAAQTNWFEATTGITLSSDFATTIEHSFRDFFVAMLSDTKLHAQINGSVPCNMTENVLVWNYAPFWLVLSYSVASAFNIIAVVIGMYCFKKNGWSMNTTFSTFIVTTRSADLDKLAEGQHMGHWPMNETLLDARLRFGELAGSSEQDNNVLHRRTAFAFSSSTVTEKGHSEFSIMDGGLSKAQTPSSHAIATKALQKKLLAAAADQDTEIPQVQSPVTRRLVREPSPLRTAKNQLSATSRSDPSPAIRARLTQTSARQPLFEEAEHVARPKPPKCRDTSLPQCKVERQHQILLTSRVQKRQIESEQDDSNNEHELRRARLTRKNLARLNRMAKRKRPSKESASASILTDSTADSSSAKTISTTSPGFAIRAHRNGIVGSLYSKPPTNLGTIHEQHAKPRASASPTESMYEHYSHTVSKIGNEATTVYNDVGFNNGLSAPQPDFTEGLEMREYDPFPVDEQVSGAVLYKDDPYSVTLSHLAGEFKSPNGAGTKPCYLSGSLTPPGHAEVRTFTTDGTNMNFYAHYAAPSEDNDRVEYHQYQYASVNIKDSYKGHKDGYRGIRNQQDHARSQSYALKDRLKKHWGQHHGNPQPIIEGAPPAYGINGESNHEITNFPSYAPTTSP
ncbi:hypothetical protein GQX73_g8888 [Xylaria multiplex]|uniref:Uncharacterized protein n=1 Tax=Xylaria multiplex TaxID=323545 RepID=A0A7C8MSS3_9PEZI|nr:hypothetical protein GQX73_g8888 [Xylaria multiplex]